MKDLMFYSVFVFISGGCFGAFVANYIWINSFRKWEKEGDLQWKKNE